MTPLIYRNDLLAAEIYPDSDDFENSSGILENGLDGVADRVEFVYNRVGERMAKRDQNGTVHSYEYDNLGRLLHDRVTTLAVGVDGTVRRISTTYDVIGNVKNITSYDASDNVVNEVMYEYGDNQKLARLYQAQDGAVNTAVTPCVEYGYADVANLLRLETMTYPSGKTLTYDYDTYNNVSAIKDGALPVVSYQHSGSGAVVKTVYNEPGLSLDYANGLDRYNRIVDHAWKKGVTDVVRIQHDYDRVGNRTNRTDVVHAADSEVYTYDGVNQIKSLNRTSFTETWDYDGTGNWLSYNKNGSIENRTHNSANEIQVTCTHDRNGNMTVMPGLKGKYDAWNRLVQVKDASDSLLATYSYNGLNQRVKKTIGGVVTKSFFNEKWQELEAQEPGAQASGLTTYIWGVRYIDDLVCRDKSSERLYALSDPNWNVVATCDSTGTVQERMCYDAFGKVSWFDAAFASKGASTYDWNRTFTGQVFDSETSLMLYRNRYYHTGLGRFVQRDPIGYRAKDTSLYRYIINRVMFATDPLGLEYEYEKRPDPWPKAPNIPGYPLPDAPKLPIPDGPLFPPIWENPPPYGGPQIPPHTNPYRGKCGVDITQQLEQVEQRVIDALNNVLQNDPSKFTDICSNMAGVRDITWDMSHLSGAGMGGTSFALGTWGSEHPCLGTVTVNNYCYYAAEVNYYLLGIVRRICAEHCNGWRSFRQGWDIIRILGHRLLEYPERLWEDADDDPPRRRPGLGTDGRITWTMVGWDGSFTNAPLASTNDCLPCPHAYNGELRFHFGSAISFEGD